MPFCGQILKQAIRATVTVMRRNQQITWLEQLQDQVQGRHARGRDRSTGTPFKFTERVSQCVSSRITAARVVVFAFFAKFTKCIVG